jgi:pyrimidine-nucleoside phosphorylase
MNPKIAIEKKREGRPLDDAEIREFVNGFTSGEIPDCQMSALAMAICCKGMDERETATLTDVMMRSGEMIRWPDATPTADKHSTGGVGDKLSFITQPLAAACGVSVPSLVGRGLGTTGGTADKLEAIPGFRVSLSLDEFRRTVAETGLSLATQTDEIAPADRKLYALRDVTGTVASIPLIVSSILSKKLAEGAGALVFDVKCGAGAFMRRREDAEELACALVAGSKAAGRRAAALVTDMDAPLGFATGNASEVAEALAILDGKADLGDAPVRLETELSIELAALMVSLAKETSLDDARAMCREKLADGSAAAKFRAMVAAQGGDLDAFSARFAEPSAKFRVQSMRSGYVASIDARKVAEVALSLGAGRAKPGDAIDFAAGVTLAVGVGDRVGLGSPLATLTASDAEPDALEEAAGELVGAFAFSRGPVEPPASLVISRI